MQESDVTKGINFQRKVYGFLRTAFGWAYARFIDLRYTPYEPKSETFLLISNHTNDLDCFFNVIITKRHMRYVANERITSGLLGKVIKFLVGPIPRVKGAPTDKLVAAVMQNLRSGISVAMYPEAIKTWDGITGHISKKTAAIAKRSGAGLITLRVDGGYLRYPHWAGKSRRGPVYAEVVREYMAQELAEMSVDEIFDAMLSDLDVNAFEYQQQHMFEYNGKDLAENVEMVCYICPKCFSIGKMHSSGNNLTCTECGYKIKYNKYGFFEGDGVVFNNTLSWSRWQKDWLKKNAQLLRSRTDAPIISNDEVTFIKGNPDGSRSVAAKNTKVFFYGDRIDIVKDESVIRSLMLDRITKLGSFRRSRVSFTEDGNFYQLKTRRPISGYQYYGLWRILTDREYE